MSGVLFRQRRVGKYGERFELLEFRTMVPDADELGAELMEKSLDPDWLVIEEDRSPTSVPADLWSDAAATDSLQRRVRVDGKVRPRAQRDRTFDVRPRMRPPPRAS